MPKLLLPYAETMTKSLDMWKSVAIAETAERANEELLKQAQTEDSKMLQGVMQLAGLYSTLLSSLSAMQFSKVER